MSPTSARTPRRAAVIGIISAAALASGATVAPAQVIREYDPIARYVVDSTGDGSDARVGDGACATAAGRCTLRAALQEAANDNATSEIGFALRPGVQVIRPGSGLPPLRDFAGPTRIDGRNVTDNNTPVELEGPGVKSAVDGLTITSTGNSVEHLAIYNFRNQIRITGWNNRVTRSVLGTNQAGTFTPDALEPFTDRAGLLLEGDAANNEIGELYTHPVVATVIAGNASPGILIRGTASSNRVRGALIGVGPTLAALANRGHGVVFGPSTRFNLVDDGSHIAGNEGNGVVIGGTLNRVAHNVLGMRPALNPDTPTTDLLAPNGATNVVIGPSTHARVHDNTMGGSAGGVRIGGGGINGARLVANTIGSSSGFPLSDPKVASAIGVEVLDGSNVAVAHNLLAYQHIGLALRVPVHQEGNSFTGNRTNIVGP